MKCTVYMTIFLLAETCSFCSHATEEDFTKRVDAGVVEGISLADQIRYCGFSFQTTGYFIVRDVCAPRFIPGLSFNREAKIYKKEIQEIAMLSNTAGFTRRLSDKYDRSFGNAWEGDTTNTVLIGGGILGGAIGLFAGGAIGVASCDWSTKEASCIVPALVAATIGESSFCRWVCIWPTGDEGN